MNSLKKILLDAAEDQHKMGGAISERVMGNLNVYRKRQFSIFIVLFAVILGIVVFCSWAIAVWPDKWKILVSTVGLSVAGGINLMRTIWKDWSQTDLLLIIFEDAREVQVQALIDKLIHNL